MIIIFNLNKFSWSDSGTFKPRKPSMKGGRYGYFLEQEINKHNL